MAQIGKTWKSENAEIPKNNMRSGFVTLKMAELSRFFRVLTSNFIHIFIDNCPSLHSYSEIKKMIKNIFGEFGKQNLFNYFPHVSQFLQSWNQK